MTPPGTPESRGDELLAFFAANLARHFRAEEEALFPALAAALPAKHPAVVLVDELIADHRRLEDLRGRVAAARSERAADAEIDAHLRAFGELLERHVRREERELFAAFDEIVTAPVAERIGAGVRAILTAPPSGSKPG